MGFLICGCRVFGDTSENLIRITGKFGASGLQNASWLREEKSGFRKALRE
jgi:hypothetical protein